MILWCVWCCGIWRSDGACHGLGSPEITTLVACWALFIANQKEVVNEVGGQDGRGRDQRFRVYLFYSGFILFDGGLPLRLADARPDRVALAQCGYLVLDALQLPTSV